jgi:hypothetical protein
MDVVKLRLRHVVGILVVVITITQIVGCAGINRRQNVRDGFLNTELVKDSFLDVWGQPDKTRIVSGDEMMKADMDRFGGSFYKGKSSYEVWEYNRYGTALVFNGKSLVNWSTTKSKDEIQKICHSDPRCR